MCDLADTGEQLETLMRLPDGDQAIIPIGKLTGYCLNPEHPAGKHKARVFASALNITIENADELEQLLYRAAIEGAVIQQDSTEFGRLFKVDWPVPGTDAVVLRSLWEITFSQPRPRLVSAFIK